jgi:NAD(P)H-dependent nitrite reductase small subunit
MTTAVKVASASEIQEGGSKIVSAEGREIALFKVEGRIYAIDNLCPHRGGPLGEGWLDGAHVTCPWHGWQFDVRNGYCRTVPESRQRCYAVKVEGDAVLVEMGA